MHNKRPTLVQLVTIRTILENGHTLQNVTFQDNCDISFIYNGKLHKIAADGYVYASKWECIGNRHHPGL